VRGKTIVLVDDSLVRGETMEGLVAMLRASGAKEVHVRIASPEIVNPCHWGIAFPTHEELLAYNYPNIQERTAELGLDSLGHLSLDKLYEAVGADEDIRKKFCAHCFGGNSPRYVPGTDGIGETGTINLIE
jgi:amidophosphoribosyltransferase